LVEKVACANQTFESNIKQKTEAKIKELKERFETELKGIRKGLLSWTNKENLENESLKKMQEVRETVEEEHNELQQECEYLRKKELEYQAERVQLKAREG
jgi:hypothetical protein